MESRSRPIGGETADGTRDRMMGGDREIWWKVARSEEVGSDKPLGVVVVGQPVVLWREPDGTVRALEDRCPHRRVPLSLGCVKPDGRLRCGYHGWTYDGATGRLQEIPNMPGVDRFPPVYRVQTFSVHEAAGFIQLSLTHQDGAFAGPAGEALAQSGTTAATIGHEEYLAAFLDAPQLVLTIPGVEFTEYLGSDPHEEGDRIVMERSCRWTGRLWPARISADFPLNLWTAIDPLTGEIEMKLQDRDFTVLMAAVLAPVPAARGATTIRWRAQWFKRNWRRGMGSAGRPIHVNAAIDATKLMPVNPSASIEFGKVRSGYRARYALRLKEDGDAEAG